MIDINLIEATTAHHPLIFNSYIMSVWSDLDKRKRKRHKKPPPQFARRIHKVVEQMLENCRVLVADTEGLAIGWAAGGGLPPALQFVYVKRDFRRRGVATSLVEELFPEGPLVVAHMTNLGQSLLEGLKRGEKLLVGAWEDD